MTIKHVKTSLQKNFIEMTEDSTHLFEVELDKDELWNLYLDSFPAGTNEIYRVRREHDCSACRQFIKKIGNAVIIKDNTIRTVFDFETDSFEYQPVMKALSDFVKSKAVSNIWVSKFSKIGTDKNYEQEEGKIVEYEHFYLELPTRFINNSGKSEGDIKGDFRATHDVFKRSLDEISEDALLTVLELIMSNTLYKGEEWKGVLSDFLNYKKKYSKLNTDEERNNFVWEQSVKAGAVVGRIRNHSIGVLLVNVSGGMDLDEAVRKYESIVAPENYRRSKPVYTKQMLEKAQAKIQELGYMDSLQRRFTTLDDISINNVLFANRDIVKKIEGGVFEELSTESFIHPKNFSKIEEITIENFIQNVLPTAKKLEVFLENRHNSNLISLISPQNRDCKTMFKWDNNFSWVYSGNITDSSMKANVKAAGGNVEGVLRFSIQWNDVQPDRNDLDAHCIEPNGYEIYFPNKRQLSSTGGVLDVDIVNPPSGIPAVENITWSSTNKMADGTYKFFVHCYSNNGGRSGFRAEIEFDGQIHSYDYGKELRQGEIVSVAEVTFDRNTGFTIVEKLPSNLSSREMWNLKSNQFILVSVVCYSPNYWNSQPGIGNKHYIFALNDCINSDRPNPFFNEFLNPELNEHRKVMEALASKLRVEDDNNQLSGLGFSSTRRNDVIVRVESNVKRILKVTF